MLDNPFIAARLLYKILMFVCLSLSILFNIIISFAVWDFVLGLPFKYKAIQGMVVYYVFNSLYSRSFGEIKNGQQTIKT